MKLKIVCVVSGVIVAGCGLTDDDPGNGILFVQSQPSGAEIWIDDSRTKSSTPDSILGLEWGRHRVEGRKVDYQTASASVTISESDPYQSVMLFLVPLTYALTITSSPSGADIFINGTPTGWKTPHTINDALFSVANIRLTKEGYYPKEEETTTGEGRTTVHLTMETVNAGHLMAVMGNEIRRVTLDGLRWTILANDADPLTDLKWSSTFEHVLYTASDGTLRFRSADGTFERDCITSWSDAWSHDATMMAYGIYFDGLYRYDLATSQITKIFDSGYRTYDHDTDFSLDDTRLVFVHHEYGSHAWIRQVNIDGSNAVTLSPQFGTSHDESIDPHWMSDEKIIFHKRHGGCYLLDIPSATITQMIEGDEVTFARPSPDRTAVAMVSNTAITVARIDPIELMLSIPLTPENEFDLWPVAELAWGYDNQCIIVRTPNGIWRLGLDGSSSRIIDERAQVRERTPPGASLVP